MTKFLTKAALAATALTALATPAMAANSDSKNFTANATIVKPLTLTNKLSLEFGSIAMLPALTSTNVSINRSGALVTCDTVVVTCSGTPRLATFTVTGVGNEKLDVKVDTSVNTLVYTDADGVDHTVAFSAQAPADITLASGTVDFTVGGTITVTSGTRDGSYTNDVPITVTYQ